MIDLISSTGKRIRRLTGAAAIIGLCAIIALLCTSPALASIETCSHGKPTFNDKVLKGGLKGATYWASSSEFDRGNSSLTTDNIKAGVSKWNKASSLVAFKSTTSAKSAKVRLYNDQVGFTNPNTLAQTHFYNSKGTETNPWKANYSKCSVQLSTSRLSKVSLAVRKGVVAHEFGHVAGLSHRNGTPSSIMCQAKKRTVQKPSSSDVANISHLYN